MTEALLIQRQRELLRDLERLAADRSRAEQEAAAGFQTRNAAATQQFEVDRQLLQTNYQAEQQALQQEFEKVKQTIALRCESEGGVTEREFADARRRMAVEYEKARSVMEGDYEATRWSMNVAFATERAKGGGRFQELDQQITTHRDRIRVIREQATRLLEPWVDLEEQPEAAPANTARRVKDPFARLAEQVEEADELLDDVRAALKAKRRRFFWILILFWLAAIAPTAWQPKLRDWQPPWFFWLAAGSAAALPIGGMLYGCLNLVARSRLRQLQPPLFDALAEGDRLCQLCLDRATAVYKKQYAEIKEQHDANLRRLGKRFLRGRLELEDRRDYNVQRAKEAYRLKWTAIKQRRDSATAQAEAKYPRLLAESKERATAAARQIVERRDRQLAQSQADRDADSQALVRSWQEGMARIRATVADLTEESRRLFAPWEDSSWQTWSPPRELPPALRFGEFTVPVPPPPANAASAAPARPGELALPALATFPDQCSMLFQAQGTGRTQAELALQMVMYRLLTTVPPGKVRFTILDPVGLGRNFAAFMHLADYDELLVASRIWTEHEHIHQRLADLTAHMENVIQKFLRNQFQTIQEYNIHAGEVAEPFRFLVVANFPVNFSTEAARRLVSIASGGARCGVYTLITVDTSQALPVGFNMAELEPYAVNFVWQEDHLAWKDNTFGPFPFRLDAPPLADFATRILQVVGEEAKRAKRVEVPFDFIAPPPERWWSADSRAGIDVPLGRAGATKRQHLQLGKGTSQHVLIAGKTGSGKSTLLHALITNISLLYSPDEVELYLVDFKEGVEFKAYATHELPHARLVAIESEREFGLSVLQQLETELKERGDRFRAAGVQDLNGYRQTKDATPLPRILLIVDEFQLFFIEEDRIAQDAALLLDRLVRQGRAFGIHVILGSQTLGGAYSLARSTIGQMTVRIALQCSESDANLILSEDNSAARLLSRPGEAIYNDANGLVEGNDYFQVVWLSDSAREDYLEGIREVARRRHHTPPRPQIVFEGKAPADPRKNLPLEQLLHAPSWPTPPRSSHVWLGDALAIKDPTAALFRAQSGSNLLIVGQDEEAALAMTGMALIGLAAQHPPSTANGDAGTRFYVLDGSPADAPHAGFLNRLTQVVPQPLRVAGWRELPEILGDVAAEVERRHQSPEASPAFWYLFVYGLQRFRDLRPQEDDYGFSRRDETKPASPSKLFTSIIREGPGVGIFTVVWCDGVTNLNRTLERQNLREFEMRVLFQMSAADSSNLIDAPLAGRLGLHRALFHSEDRGQPEKFRPYSIPPEDWLEGVRKGLHRSV
jgi:hypothetical protein